MKETDPDEFSRKAAMTDQAYDRFQRYKHLEDQCMRFERAARCELGVEESIQAWREFSDIAARAMRTGRLWQPFLVFTLAICFLPLVEEQDEIERAEGGGAIPPNTVDAISKMFGEDDEHPRRLTGYLSRIAQPSSADETSDPGKAFTRPSSQEGVL